MSSKTIHLTRGQAESIRLHADTVAPQFRRRFMDAVQEVLLGEEPTDSDVQLVIDQLLKRMPRR